MSDMEIVSERVLRAFGQPVQKHMEQGLLASPNVLHELATCPEDDFPHAFIAALMALRTVRGSQQKEHAVEISTDPEDILRGMDKLRLDKQAPKFKEGQVLKARDHIKPRYVLSQLGPLQGGVFYRYLTDEELPKPEASERFEEIDCLIAIGVLDDDEIFLVAVNSRFFQDA